MLAATRALAQPGAASEELCAHFVSALPIERAAILTLAAPFDVVAFASSDAVAALIADLEIDLGEGPGWDALRTHGLVQLTEPGSKRSEPWPAFRNAISPYGVTDLYALPLAVGALEIGSVDLYVHSGRHLTGTELADAATLADLAAMQVMRHAMTHRDDPDDDALFSRREVHQATGMVLAQLRISTADALLLIRAHAFAANRPVRAVAADIVHRRITFAP